MRMVGTDELTGDEVLAQQIIDSTGRVLLSRGNRIRLSYLNKFSELGIYRVYIEDGISEGIEVEGILCDETKNKAMSIVQGEMSRYLKSKDVNVYEIQKITNTILQEVLANKSGLINLKDIRVKDEYTFSHSVNVCALSVLLATKLGFSQDKVQSIGAGCLLHDFGKMLIPATILNKPGKLTDEEFAEIKKHPVYGYEAVKKDFTVSPVTKVVILMHHERLDGSGYPSGLMSDKIHESAKICSICDVFDAMTSDRVYRKAMSISYAVEYLHSTGGIHFEKEYVKEFLKNVPIYPAGTLVLLNTGVVGIVMKNNRESLIRPIVRLLYNPKTKIKYNNLTLNMMEDLTTSIIQVVNIDINELNRYK